MRTKMPKTFKKVIFGQRLKELREQLGLTQEEFGGAINRTRSAYVVIEGGKVAPSADCLGDIKNYLKKNGINVSMDYLYGLSDHKNESGFAKEIENKYNDLLKEHESLLKISNLQEQLLKAKEQQTGK